MNTIPPHATFTTFVGSSRCWTDVKVWPDAVDRAGNVIGLFNARIHYNNTDSVWVTQTRAEVLDALRAVRATA